MQHGNSYSATLPVWVKDVSAGDIPQLDGRLCISKYLIDNLLGLACEQSIRQNLSLASVQTRYPGLSTIDLTAINKCDWQRVPDRISHPRRQPDCPKHEPMLQERGRAVYLTNCASPRCFLSSTRSFCL